MMGKSHLAFNAASAVIVSSFIHVGGKAYSFSYVLALLEGHLLATSLLLPSLGQKCIYYLLVLFGALLPDIDHPNSTFGKRCGFVSRGLQRLCGHRSITHSIAALVLLYLLCMAFESVGIAVCSIQHIVLSNAIKGTLHLAYFSLLLGYALHLLGDSLTKEGIPLLWPYRKRYGLIPLAVLRFRVGTWAEHMLLWSFIFCVGVGFGVGTFSF